MIRTDVTLLASLGAVSASIPAPIDTVVDLTDDGLRHRERCQAHWPQAQVHTGFDVGAATPLDDYAQLKGLTAISLLLLPVTSTAVKWLLGAGSLLAGGHVRAVALLGPAAETLPAEALGPLARVLGKYGFNWAILDGEAVSLALLPDAPPKRLRSWVGLAKELDIPVTGVIRVGSVVAPESPAAEAAGYGPLFWIDRDLSALERQRTQLAGAREVTCIGAAVSDVERRLTLHIDKNGRGTYVATPEAYDHAHSKAGVEQFIEITTRTLDTLADKYPLASANVLVLDLPGEELAALRGAARLLEHVDLVTLSPGGTPAPRADRKALDAHMRQHGFLGVFERHVSHDMSETLVYAHKRRLWHADPLAMIHRVMQAANVALGRVGWQGAAAGEALHAARSLSGRVAFSGLELTPVSGPGAPDDIDVMVVSNEGLPALRVLLEAALASPRLGAILFWGELSAGDVDAATRMAFDHGFLIDRASASASVHAFLRSSVIRDPADWLATNNAFGRRHFRFSSLGAMGQFGNQLFQIMHLLLSSLRHDARASTCAWPHNEYFRLGFLESTDRGTVWEVAPGMWQVMAVWALEELPDDIDYRGHLQWIAPFLSRHAAFIGRCFDLKPAWAARVRQMIERLRAGFPTLTAFHVRRTDYLTAVLENPWHQEIPMAWYRRALEKRSESRIFAASDDLEYVRESLPGLNLTTHAELADCGLPPLLIDHCVMRAADTLLMVNSTFSRTAGLLAPAAQTVLLPSPRHRAFLPYVPWHDAAFWARFDDRYFADPEAHAEAIDRWLAAVGVPQLLRHEKP